MSRPRSRSPRYRRFPWEEPDFSPDKVLSGLDVDPMDRSHRSREDPEEHLDHSREDVYLDGQRRSPPHFVHQRLPDQRKFQRWMPSPRRDAIGCDARRPSPPFDEGGAGFRHRGGFRENFRRFEDRESSPRSPPRSMRERSAPTPRPHSDRPGMGWRGGEPGRGPGRFRDLSPSSRSDYQRGGAGRERGRRMTQGHNRGRPREFSHQDRNPPFKRQRRDLDDGNHPGYRDEEHFEQRYSADSSGFGGDAPSRRSGPLVIEHDHGRPHGGGELPRWKQYDGRGDPGADLDRRRSPRPRGSSLERFRTPGGGLDDQEDVRGRHFQDNWRQASCHGNRSSPSPQDRPNPARYGGRDSPMDHRQRGHPRPARGQNPRGRGGRIGPHRNQPRVQPSSQGYQDPPREEERPEIRPSRDYFEDPVEGESDWAEQTRPNKPWKRDRSGSLDRHPAGIDPDPKMPRQRMEREWSSQKPDSASAVTGETLTIKVDMSRPANQNSSPCYSSDRQLSLDLVNVGRQRLDFLPMLEHSGTYRETAMHTGTFAQEIITLVHQVKDQYFRDGGVTLNERFSAPQQAGFAEEEAEELTLNQRFSSNRGFSLNLNSVLDDDEEDEEEEPLFCRQGSLPPVRDPGDLRHDLERRRQERLEGVKVTISGGGVSQRPLGLVSDPSLEFGNHDDGFSNWPEEQSRRPDGNMRPRREPPFRPNAGPQRRNHRFGNRIGPTRRHHNPAGPNW